MNIEHIIWTIQKNIHEGIGLLPCIVSEDDACTIINSLLSESFHSLDEIGKSSKPNIILIEWELRGDKQAFRMEDSKRFIEKISIQPYESFSIYILRSIDTATHQASNSLLKILEDTPPYALILLTATFPEGLLDTIRSRTIFISWNTLKKWALEDTVKMSLRKFSEWKKQEFLTYLYKENIKREEALAIVYFYYECVNKEKCSVELLNKIENTLSQLFRINTQPKYILDLLFT